MFSVVTKYHKGRHSLFLYNSEIFYAFTQDILRSRKMAYQVLIKKQKPQTMAVQTADKLHLYVNKANAKAIGLQPSTIKQP